MIDDDADRSRTGRVVYTARNVGAISNTADGRRIELQRGTPMGAQLFTMAPTLNPDGTLPTATQITFANSGMNMTASWGELKTTDPKPTP